MVLGRKRHGAKSTHLWDLPSGSLISKTILVNPLFDGAVHLDTDCLRVAPSGSVAESAATTGEKDHTLTSLGEGLRLGRSCNRAE